MPGSRSGCGEVAPRGMGAGNRPPILASVRMQFMPCQFPADAWGDVVSWKFCLSLCVCCFLGLARGRVLCIGVYFVLMICVVIYSFVYLFVYRIYLSCCLSVSQST